MALGGDDRKRVSWGAERNLKRGTAAETWYGCGEGEFFEGCRVTGKATVAPLGSKELGGRGKLETGRNPWSLAGCNKLAGIKAEEIVEAV